MAGTVQVASNAVERTPTEIWTLIFKLVESENGLKSLVALRQVCKFWRDVVDDNFDFQPTVKDDISHFSYMRVKQCVITSLSLPLQPRNKLFRDPQILTKLTIKGPITRKNFFIMVAQFLNLEDVAFDDDSMGAANLFTSSTRKEMANLNRFLGTLKSMKMTGVSVGTHLLEDLPALNNFTKVMSTDMPNLKTLEINFDMCNLSDLNLLSFLEERAPNLEALLINCSKGYLKPSTKVATVDAIDVKEPKPLHLRTLEMRLSRDCGVDNWLPIIKQQRSLENLKLQVKNTRTSPIRPDDCFKFSDLEETLALNVSTLEYLELENFTVFGHLNASVFQEMDKLKELKLIRYATPDSSSVQIMNLSMLPGIIETIKLQGFTCDFQEIDNEIKILKNLQYIEVNGFQKVEITIEIL